MKQMLNNEYLEKVNGGLIVDSGDEKTYYLVKEDGSVVAPIPGVDKAMEFARTLELGQELLTMDEYEKRFGKKLEWNPLKA